MRKQFCYIQGAELHYLEQFREKKSRQSPSKVQKMETAYFLFLKGQRHNYEGVTLTHFSFNTDWEITTMKIL